AGYRHIPGYFDLTATEWREFKRFLASRTEVAWQTDGYVLFRIVRPHPPRPLPALPIYDALAYAEADRALSEGRAQAALTVFANPPPLLRDVGATYIRQGDAYLLLDDAGRARRAFMRALTLGADGPRIRTGLAQAHLRLGRPKEGLAHAESGWRQNPLSAYAAATLALTYQRTGRIDDARRLIRQSIRLRPDVADYRNIARQLGAL
ncbi:unnamed protein product, partial [marine sediment metagenome]